MVYEITIAPEAEKCIEEQISWYEEDEEDPNHGGSALADRWLDLLQVALVELKSNPERFGFAPENGKWQADLEIRQMPFRPWKKKTGWRILFLINSDESNVTVIQIRHERRPLLHEKAS